MIGEWELEPKGDHEMRLFTTAQSGDTAWWTAKESAPNDWTKMDVSGLPGNGSNGTAYLFDYDPDHHILYASLQRQGLWRMRTY